MSVRYRVTGWVAPAEHADRLDAAADAVLRCVPDAVRDGAVIHHRPPALIEPIVRLRDVAAAMIERGEDFDGVQIEVADPHT